MGFLKSLKGKFHADDDDTSHTQQPPAYQPPSQPLSDKDHYADNTTKNEKAKVFGEPSHDQEFAPPPGPPPSRYRDEKKSDPFSSGQPVMGSSSTTEPYSASNTYPSSKEEYAPPPNPPPNHIEDSETNSNPPPYQSWFSVPDNSTLPPPPSLHSDYSPSNNASISAADAGHQWCDTMTVYSPAMPSNILRNAVGRGEIGLDVPWARFRGQFNDITNSSGGQYGGLGIGEREARISRRYLMNSPLGQDDMCVTSVLPLYFAMSDNPLMRLQEQRDLQAQHQRGGPDGGQIQAQPVSISYSVLIKRLADADASVAIGLSNAPYPFFRLPGWHRGSLAVHSDDGHRYINDPWGGLPFTSPLGSGDLVTITATVYPELSPLQKSRNEYAIEVSRVPKCRTRIQMQVKRRGRNDVWEGGWDIHEEMDERIEGVEGLQGEGDLYATIGLCGGCEIEIMFWSKT